MLKHVATNRPFPRIAGQDTSGPVGIAGTFQPAYPVGVAAPHQLEAPVVSLRLIATTDLHASLLPYDYCANRVVAGRSLSEVSHEIARARAEVPNSLLFDNGDFLQGNPLADYIANAPRRRRAHPVITAFNTLGYDAVTLGNHEFNYGLGFLGAALARAKFPVVSANIATRLGKTPVRDKTLVPPFVILPRTVTDQQGRSHRLKIGVIGFAPPQIEVWDRQALKGRIRMRDILASAREWLPRLRERGADLIVALAHSGIGPAEHVEGTENAATALAALPEVDAVIAGHCHMAFPGPGVEARPGVDPVLGLLSGKPAVMPGHSGSHVGIIDLKLIRMPGSARGWSVAASESRLVSPAAEPGAGAVALRQAIAPDHRAALAWSRRVLGETRVPLSTHFATVAPSAALNLIAEAKADHVRKALAGTKWEELPLLSSAAPFRAGGRGGALNFTEIPVGQIRMRNISDLYTYPNMLVALSISGAAVADWLEQSAGLFRQIRPGEQDAALLDADVPSFTFDVVPRLSYAIDLSQPARFHPDGRLANPEARRIVGLRLDGAPLDPKARVIMVTNNHRAGRAMQNAGPGGPEVVLTEGNRMQAVLADYVRERKRVGAPAARNWHFLPMPGTTVRFETGPAAEAHLDDVAHYRPQRIGADAEGFLHYRLHL